MVSMTAALVAPHDGGMADDPAARPRRRRFSPEYKLAILAEYDRLTEPGDKGALLRREGLYTSHIVEWRRARDAGALSGLAAQARRPRRTPEQVELERVRRRNQRLEAELARTKAALEIVGKATRSWSSSPRARTASRGPAGDRRRVGGAGAPGADQAGVRAGWPGPRQPGPAASASRGTDQPPAASPA
jgi:transposase